MRIEVNGDAHDVEQGCTLGAVVDEHVDDRRGVAVAVDGDVVTRASWDETVLDEGARIELVGAVQGG